MKKTAARTRIVHTTTNSFKAMPPCEDRTSLMRVAMLFTLLDMVGAAAVTTGALTPSFPKTGSSDGSRTKTTSNVRRNNHLHSTVFQTPCMPNEKARRWPPTFLMRRGRGTGDPVIWRRNFNAVTLQAGIADGAKACSAVTGGGEDDDRTGCRVAEGLVRSAER